MRETLTKLVDPDLDFLSSLLGKDVITEEQFDEINTQPNIVQKNHLLIGCLLHNDQVDLSQLMQILEETGQRHVSNFIASAGGIWSLVSFIFVPY